MTRIAYLQKQFNLIPQSHSMHSKFRYRGTCMQLSISLKLVLTKLISGITQKHVTDALVLTTSCFAVQFRASFKGKASFVQHLEPAFERK